jgi:hypothetical protein
MFYDVVDSWYVCHRSCGMAHTRVSMIMLALKASPKTWKVQPRHPLAPQAMRTLIASPYDIEDLHGSTRGCNVGQEHVKSLKVQSSHSILSQAAATLLASPHKIEGARWIYQNNIADQPEEKW